MKEIEVVAAVIVDKGKILATQRSKGEFQGLWEFPGGKIEVGETPEEALVREIQEELEAEIELDEFIKTIEWDYPTFHLKMHCYFCTLLSESLQLKEHAAGCWLDRDHLDAVQWLPADLALLPEIDEYLCYLQYLEDEYDEEDGKFDAYA